MLAGKGDAWAEGEVGYGEAVMPFFEPKRGELGEAVPVSLEFVNRPRGKTLFEHVLFLSLLCGNQP